MKIKLRTLLIIMIVIAFIVILHFATKDYEIHTDGATVFSYDISAKNPHGVISSEDFVYVNDIGIKIEQLKVSELNLDLTIQFDMNRVLGSSIGYSYCVFDENSNIYVYRNDGNALKGIKRYIRKRNMQYDKKWTNDKEGVSIYHNLKTISSENGYITTNVHSQASFLFGTQTYTKNDKNDIGKTLYIELWNANGDKNFDVIFEYHLPDNFYDDTVFKYKLAENPYKEIKLIYAGCDEYNFTLCLAIPNIYYELNDKNTTVTDENNYTNNPDKIYFTDENGNKYNSIGKVSVLNRLKTYFDINKNNPPKELLLHIITREEPIKLVPVNE